MLIPPPDTNCCIEGAGTENRFAGKAGFPGDTSDGALVPTFNCRERVVSLQRDDAGSFVGGGGGYEWEGWMNCDLPDSLRLRWKGSDFFEPHLKLKWWIGIVKAGEGQSAASSGWWSNFILSDRRVDGQQTRALSWRTQG